MIVVKIASLEFEDVAEGLEAGFAVDVTGTAVQRFAELSGDFCPLHTNDDFAMGRGFQGRVVHGTYLMALVSRLVGTALPGRNGIMAQVQLAFHKPTYVGDSVRVLGRVERKLDALRAIVVSVGIDASGSAGERRVASGKVQVAFTAQVGRNGRPRDDSNVRPTV